MQQITSQISSDTNRAFRVALVGNPNSGKTTIFNSLTGLRHKVANYPGVTVEKKEGQLATSEVENVTIVDLPGIYSLSGLSIDEKIASRALLGKVGDEPAPDLIVAVLDATNLERNLFLTTELIDLGIPVIVTLNMSDLAEKQGIVIRKEILARLLDVLVVSTTAQKGQGITELKRIISEYLKHATISKQRFAWRQAQEDSAATNKDCEATARYRWINTVVKRSCTLDPTKKSGLAQKIDMVVTHKIWGSLIFITLMAVIFQSIFLFASIPMDFIDQSFSNLGNYISALLPPSGFRSLVVNGIIAGVGSVLIFIPQIAILFFFLGLLEDSGYLSRAAFLMDRIMRHVGLQGRSFIPLLSSFACAIPGIMATRTIPSFADRMTTILIAPLMSCSARLPVYTLLISAFVPSTYYYGFISLQGLVMLAMYLLGVVAAAGIAWLLKISLLRGEPALFVMEMPIFRLPLLRSVLREVIDRVVLFVKSAGTMILACSIVLWFLASYPSGEIHQSYAGRIGTVLEPIIHPLGFNWEIGVGILASFAAREVFITSMATVYNLENSSDTAQSLVSLLQGQHAAGSFPLASALALMVFYVFACQCMSTLAVCRRETGSWRWPAFMFSYMTILAYGASFITYRVFLFWG